MGLQTEQAIGLLLPENGLMGLLGGLTDSGVSRVIQLASTLFGACINDIPTEVAVGMVVLILTFSLLITFFGVNNLVQEKPWEVLGYA